MRINIYIILLLILANPAHAQILNKPENDLQVSDCKCLQINLSNRLKLKSFSNNYPEDYELGKHIISIRPIGILKRDWRDRLDTAFAISYEQILGNGKLAIRIPVEIGLHSKSYFISPTLKLYSGRQGTVRYAIGPQLTLGSGLHNLWVDDPKLGYTDIQVRRTQIGLMLNQSVNITIAHSFYIGLDLGLGAMVYNSVKNDSDAAGLAVLIFGPIGFIGFISPSMQGGLSIGFRF